jgi:cell wall-associated NlpC family hydrolase
MDVLCSVGAADQQEAAGTQVGEHDLRPGDLVTYGD